MRRHLMGFFLALLGLWSGFAGAADAVLATKNDRLSYALGIETAQSFKTHGIELNPSAFTQGFQDASSNNAMLMTKDEINQELKDFQHSASTKLESQRENDAQKNQQIGSSFLAANKERPGVKTTSSGLQYKILSAGSGSKPTLNDVVTVDYEGRLLDGKIFDSSYERGQPATFPLNGVILGWQEALQLMPEGSTWEIYIPPNLAYGKNGAQGVIGPNETLIFKVRLIKIKSNENNGNET